MQKHRASSGAERPPHVWEQKWQGQVGSRAVALQVLSQEEMSEFSNLL